MKNKGNITEKAMLNNGKLVKLTLSRKPNKSTNKNVMP
jgi:hypothetical protein